MTHLEFIQLLDSIDVDNLQLKENDKILYKATKALGLPKYNFIVIEDVSYDDLSFYEPLKDYGIIPNYSTGNREIRREFKILKSEEEIVKTISGYVTTKVFIEKPINSLEEFEQLNKLVTETYGCGLVNYTHNFKLETQEKNKKLDLSNINNKYNLLTLDTLPMYEGYDIYIQYKEWIDNILAQLENYDGLLVTADDWTPTDLFSLYCIFSKKNTKLVITNSEAKSMFLDLASNAYTSSLYLIEDRVEKLKRYFNVCLMVGEYGVDVNYVVFNKRPEYILKQVTLIPFKYVKLYRITKEVKESAIIQHNLETDDLIPIRSILDTSDKIKDAIKVFAEVLKYKKVVTVNNLFATEINDQIYIGYGELELNDCKVDIIDCEFETVIEDISLNINQLNKIFPLSIIYDLERDDLFNIFKNLKNLYDFKHKGISPQLGFSNGENIYYKGMDTTMLYSMCTRDKNTTIRTNSERSKIDYDIDVDFYCMLGCDCFRKVRNQLQSVFTKKYSLSGFYMYKNKENTNKIHKPKAQELNIFGGFELPLPIVVNSSVFGDVFYEYNKKLEETEDDERRNYL